MAIQDDWRQAVAVVRPQFSVEAAQRAGVLPSDIAAALERNYVGQQIGVYRDKDRLIPILERAPADERSSVEGTRQRPGIQCQRGQRAGEPVRFRARRHGLGGRADPGRNRFPTIKAQCDPPAGQLSAPLFERLRPQIEAIALPPGYVLEWHGGRQASAEANAGLAAAAPFGFAAMVVAVIVMFNGLRQTAVIWLTVPLAVVGVAVGLLLFQAPFSSWQSSAS